VLPNQVHGAFMINYWNCEWFNVGGINVIILATLDVDHCEQYCNCHNIAVEFLCESFIEH
jgi:hypothetical protein